MSGNHRIIKYRSPFRLSVGLVIILVLFLYILFSAKTNLGRNKISFYEVTDGGMAKDTEHVGIAVRDEQTQYSSCAGYINLFVSSGKRVSVGEYIYAVDETGAMNKYLNSSDSGEAVLSKSGFDSIKKHLSEFSSEYDDRHFNTVYDEKSYLNSAILEYSGRGDSLDDLMNESGIALNKFTSPLSGIISFDIDGYEGKASEVISEEDFNKNSYSSTHIRSGELIEKDAPVYKIVSSETWDIIFPVTEEEKQEYSEAAYLTVKFKNKNISCTPSYTQINSADGNTYGKLTLNKYMVDFINERYITFDIESDSRNGLKIPRSAVVEKTFLTVPAAYIARGGDGLEEGFYKQTAGAKGSTVQFIPTEIYYQNDDEYYIAFSSESDFQPGDTIVMPGSSQVFQVGKTENLQGVYNINKGYAVFKQIEILDSNDEYYTVRKNQKYGLAVYDHILFDPEGINEGDFIYQ